MESWYRMELSADEIIAGKEFQLVNEFVKIRMKNRLPRAFILGDTAKDASGFTFYFSPAFVQIAKGEIVKWGGIPCEVPYPKGMSLIVGSDKAVRATFPRLKGNS